MIWFVLFLQKYEISWFAVSLQRFFDAFSGSFTHNGGYFFQARLFDTGNTLEGFEQGCFPLFSYTFDVVEGGSYLTLAPFVPMERNGKTVHFILYIFQQVEQGSPLLDTEYYRGESVKYLRICPFPPSVRIRSGSSPCSSSMRLYRRRTTSCMDA